MVVLQWLEEQGCPNPERVQTPYQLTSADNHDTGKLQNTERGACILMVCPCVQARVAVMQWLEEQSSQLQFSLCAKAYQLTSTHNYDTFARFYMQSID